MPYVERFTHAQRIALQYIRESQKETLEILGLKPINQGNPNKRLERKRDHMGRFMPEIEQDEGQPTERPERKRDYMGRFMPKEEQDEDNE